MLRATNVTLLLELLNSRVDHPGYQADHTAWGLQVCTLAGAANVRLLYDIYHMQIMEGDVIRARLCSALSLNVRRRLMVCNPNERCIYLLNLVCNLCLLAAIIFLHVGCSVRGRIAA